MELLDLEMLLFDIREDHIEARGGQFHFFVIKPPNFSTLDESERALYYRQFQNLMRSTTEHAFFICALDRTVSLSQNRDYLLSLDDRYGEIKDAQMADLAMMENAEGNTQRSYYYGIFVKKPMDVQRFEDTLRAAGTDYDKATFQELVLLMRSFNLREFVDSEFLYDPDEAPLVYGKKGVKISPVVRHLLPTALSFDNDINIVTQTNFVRKAFVVRNLPQKIRSHNSDLLKKIVQMSNSTVMIRISDMNARETQTLVNKQYSNSTAGLFKNKITQVIESEADALNAQQFYRETQEDATEGGAMKYVNIYIETYGKNKAELDTNARRIKTLCEAYGVTIEDFVFRQEEGYFGTSPIGKDTRGKLLANNIPSRTLGQLYPFSSSYLNDVTGMLLGRTVDNGMVSLDIWNKSTYRTNSNVAIIGDSGMGKSHLTKKIISMQRPRGTTIWILDSENEYSDEVRQLGGKVINCSAGDFAVNPLQIRLFKSEQDDDSMVDERDTAFAESVPFFQHLSWLKDFIKILLPNISPLQVAAFAKIVRDVYKKWNIDERTDIRKFSNEQYPVFSDVYYYIENVVNHPDKYPFYSMIDTSDLRALLLLLDDVCLGSLSLQFNRHTNAADSSLVNLNIQGLLMGSQDNMQATLFNYLTYIWGKVTERTAPLLLAIDELYLLANEHNPIMLKYLNSFERRARKYDAGLLISTQKVMDCLNERIIQWTSAIFDTPTYKFLFYPGDVDLDALKVKLRLTAGEIDSISLPERKNCLLKVGKEKYHMTVGTLSYEAQLYGRGGGS